MGEIFAEVALMTVVGKGIIKGCPCLGNVRTSDPNLPGLTVGVPSGVIVLEASVSARMRSNDCVVPAACNAELVFVFAPVAVANVKSA